mgnify:CR=1 FL=1|jgi:hypothetical protein
MGDLLPLCVRSRVTKTCEPTDLGTSILLGDFDDLDHMAGKVQACWNLALRTLGLVRSMVILGKRCVKITKVTTALADACKHILYINAL